MNFEKNAIAELKVPQKEAFAEKKDDLELVKAILQERFGKENLSKELIQEMLSIRKDIAGGVERDNFVEELDDATDNRIKLLVAKINNSEFNPEEVKEIRESENGDIEVSFKNKEKEILGDGGQELLFSLRLYFDSYRLAINANKFRSNVNEIKTEIIKDNKDNKTNFYKESEKQEEILAKLQERYEQAGFSSEEIKELLEICDLKDLDALPVHEIKIMSKIKDIFSRFMNGDKTKYIGLSAALMVPAFVQGWAPMFFANAFKDNKTDISQIILYGIASFGGAFMSVQIQKQYKDL